MEILELISSLEKSPAFKKWQQSNKKSFLMYCFNIVEDHVFRQWNIGYYSKKKIKVFVQTDKGFELSEECDPTQTGQPIKPLKMERVKVNTMQALEKAFKLIKEEYPKVDSPKTIIILQNIKIGQIWNLTFIGRAFDILNIKIDAETGKILEHSSKPFIKFSSGAS